VFKFEYRTFTDLNHVEFLVTSAGCRTATTIAKKTLEIILAALFIIFTTFTAYRVVSYNSIRFKSGFHPTQCTQLNSELSFCCCVCFVICVPSVCCSFSCVHLLSLRTLLASLASLAPEVRTLRALRALRGTETRQ